MSFNMPVELEKRICQLVISRLNGDQIRNDAYVQTLKDLVAKGVGGFIVFGGSRGELGDFIHELQSLAEVPLFIASDIERGVGQQIDGAGFLPCPMAMAAALDRKNPEDAALLRRALDGLADEALDSGINMPLIPVMDVNQEPDNPIICTRAFSDDPETVSWFGSEYIRALEQAGLISCAKHFPGHGDTVTDSHIALPVIRKSLKELTGTDLAPFVKAVGTGVSSLMVGHLAVPCLDEIPATFSRKIMQGLLREQMGFTGLIVTDALDMNALNNYGDMPVKCLNAGADVLLHPADVSALVNRLLSAVASGEVVEDTVNKAVGRILKAKERLARLPQREADYDGNRGLSSDIAGRSITLVKNTPGLLPLKGKNRAGLVVAGDPGLSSDSPLFSEFGGVDAAGSETVLVAIFTTVAAWRESSGISNEERERIAAIIKKAKKSILVSFGSPYVLRYFGEADILIAAYESTHQVQESVIKRLVGEKTFMGRLPVKLNGVGR
ncbi:MAG: glycoside hydrolase family 3 protein [Nitrospirae bacterium]|nr:glycoside hydrolase family 3 protein [Nitrospirota bacterium]